MPPRSVSAAPTKRFFVEMLTRDIELSDAILDLLDNCIDGILRSKIHLNRKKPFAGKYAHITARPDLFEIKDNCGGIPEDRIQYAFRIGREISDKGENIESIGVYGIGMKRAIFKMGRHCTITTKNAQGSFSVSISPTWMFDDKDWDLPVIEPEEELALR
jgi:DNA topoisomerase VI subunit B